jgi:hypothetical protein
MGHQNELRNSSIPLLDKSFFQMTETSNQIMANVQLEKLKYGALSAIFGDVSQLVLCWALENRLCCVR